MTKKTDRHPTRTLQSITVKRFIDDYVYRIDLDADYQREKIWSRDNQEELIDSILQNIDIPKLYLVKVTGNDNFDYECIDGKQRMGTLLSFYKPDTQIEKPLTVRVGERYSYRTLRKELPQLADKIDEFELTFVVYTQIDDDKFVREIFRRLQLGVRLNSGELLKTYTGTMRDFVFDEMGKNAAFLRRTKLSEKRFSRQFTLAQIAINSFSLNSTGEFVRARYDDLGEFFKQNDNLNEGDGNFKRIREVLDSMEKHFAEGATAISSRAVAVSAYLFVEALYVQKEGRLTGEFARFFVELLAQTRANLKLLSRFREPTNRTILERFQKHISQASVEPYAIKSRHEFLAEAFNYYRAAKTKGQILGGS
jgi:hypothetical protein